MPFQRNPETGRMEFSFTNLLALIVVLIGCFYFYWISFQMTKTEFRDNTALQQITIFMVTTVTLVLNYYFGNSNNSAKQAQQITEMQKTTTSLVTKTAEATLANVTTNAAANTENKIDKAVKIEQLKVELEKLQPESEEAKKILAEIEELEKKD